MASLSPFTIGPLSFATPVTLAPLAGYSDLPFRTLCRRFGAPLCTTEMMLDRCVEIAGKQQVTLIASDENDHPTAGQLVGNEPEVMAHAARLLANRNFDIIDLNFACPVNKALRRRRGGFLMSDPKLVVEIVQAVVEEIGGDKPVTLKVRQRFKDADTEENFWHLAEGARQAGAAAITVHARSVEKKYRGRADWDFLRRVKEHYPDWTVLGSGDVLTPQAALDLLEQTGLDACVVARGVLGNPWFFQQVNDLAAGNEPHQPSLTEQRDVMLAHMDLALPLYGPDKAPRFMRKFGIKYARMHPTPKAVRQAFLATKKPQDWYDVIDHYYTKYPPPPMSDDSTPHLASEHNTT